MMVINVVMVVYVEGREEEDGDDEPEQGHDQSNKAIREIEQQLTFDEVRELFVDPQCFATWNLYNN